ncbi:MAG: RloB family protein [Clostridium sp.]|nr:RloB family protein [Clostridium sp.]
MKLKKSAEKSRKKGTRRVNPTIVIICEGKETEVNYFEGFDSKYTRVDVKVADKKSRGKDKGKATDCKSLVERAIYYKENKYDINEEDGDRVWCVFDVDINYKNNNAIQSKIDEIEKARPIADRNKISLGVSNPCFELWFLLHFEYTTANLKNYDAVIQKLNKYISDYEKNKDIYEELKKLTDKAIDFGKRLRKHHESLGRKLPNVEKDKHKAIVKDLVESNPYTNIGDLVDYMEELERHK